MYESPQYFLLSLPTKQTHNVFTTSLQRHDVAATLSRRSCYVVYLLGSCNISFSDNLHLKSHCLGTNNTFRNVSRMSRECQFGTCDWRPDVVQQSHISGTFWLKETQLRTVLDGFETPATTTLWLFWETIWCAFFCCFFCEHVQHSSDRRTRGPVGPITVRYRLKETDSWESSLRIYLFVPIRKAFVVILSLVVTIILGDIFFFFSNVAFELK